jgi:hypothetical protein
LQSASGTISPVSGQGSGGSRRAGRPGSPRVRIVFVLVTLWGVVQLASADWFRGLAFVAIGAVFLLDTTPSGRRQLARFDWRLPGSRRTLFALYSASMAMAAVLLLGIAFGPGTGWSEAAWVVPLAAGTLVFLAASSYAELRRR